MKLLKQLFNSGEILIFIATVIAAIGWMASKEVIAGMSPMRFIGLRFLLAGFALLPWCFYEIRLLSFKVMVQVLLLGALLTLSILIWIYALDISPTMGEGAFIMTTAVLLSPLIGWGLFRTPPNRTFWLILPLAISGVACLSLTNGWQPAKSQVFFLISAFLLSLHFNFNKYFSNMIKVLPLVCLQLFFVGFCSLLLSVFQDASDRYMSVAAWGWFFTSALLCTSLRYVLQTRGQHRISTSNAALMMILEPIWVLLFAISFYHESLSLQKIGGCLLIITALLLYCRQLR